LIYSTNGAPTQPKQTHGSPMTLGNVRDLGVRRLDV
jgi:hypothetical protein